MVSTVSIEIDQPLRVVLTATDAIRTSRERNGFNKIDDHVDGDEDAESFSIQECLQNEFKNTSGLPKQKR